jgi:hypothetical protein
MTGWPLVLVASFAVFALKLAGQLAPRHWLERPDVARYAALLTAGLLAALVAVQTVGAGAGIRLDARIPAIAVAALLLWRRMPFIVVVLAAALTAAGLRALGLP